MAPSPSSSPAATTSVQVAVRIRPTTKQDAVSIPPRFQRSVVHASSHNLVAVDAVTAAPGSGGPALPTGTANKKQLFTFDQVHSPDATQHALFTTTAEPLIHHFVDGFNCTILAYGQTSSGKTFTMTGIDLDADPSDPDNGMGIIPRAVATIFQRARALKEERGGAWNFNIKGSYIEIYNEDLVDLLSEDAGRKDVSIREDKDGHIIWSGLREVSVKSAREVMSLIRQGAAIRRTNETDMNAQSSRSHAIFSLTLIQKKYTGSGPPPRSSSPLPPTGRPASRLARPGSMLQGAGGNSRVSSPTFGRPGTPSFQAAMDRGGLRPPSSLGQNGGDDTGGEWKTIVSKFHFVDLAGSERLKRTAAAGDRAKEGISINSGLLALGNVISALGDPSRSKSGTATHVPYRDSKLTRLLQDSLGGNAHTLMIACVSPAEWNAGETINTLKYANRARNIKNRAVINEKEEGWDDVDWLQNTVSRLRKELKSLKEGGPAAITAGKGDEPQESAPKKVLEQMDQLRNNYEDLGEKFTERTEELTRLRRELGEKQRDSSSGTPSTAKYEEIVGPVIEEYEKTISAMEAELSLNKAALRHTNELYEEKEAELVEVSEKAARTEEYVEELNIRLAKLTEREAATEAYVHDLEEKIKSYDETKMSSSESMSDLKKEITRFKDAESYTAQYIADLEGRLAKSDNNIQNLHKLVDKLEEECERRREEVRTLQTRLDALQNDGKAWRKDLEAREKRVKDLESRMKEWEEKRKEAGEERERLGNAATDVARARESLEVDGAAAASFKVNGAPIEGGVKSGEEELESLKKSHAETLADLSSVTAKYRDALREISDLAAQIQEVKLSSASPLPAPPHSPVFEIPPYKRRGMRSREASESGVQYNTGRKFMFRHAVSTESLHSRSMSQSPSLSQELSSAQSHRSPTSSHASSSSISSTHSPSASLIVPGRPDLSITTLQSVPARQEAHQRSISSLEKEIMRLQEVLNQRESEIAVLEKSLHEKDQPGSSPGSAPEDARGNGDASSRPSTPGKDEDDASGSLSPKTRDRFKEIRKSFQLLPASETANGSVLDADESLVRLNELMRSMAQKESSHREEVEDLNGELKQVRRQLDDLTTLSRDQTLNMASEIEALQKKHMEDLQELSQVQQRENELVSALEQARADHDAEMSRLTSQHEAILKAKEAEMAEVLARVHSEHEATLRTVRSEHAEALERQTAEAAAALDRLRDEHASELRQLEITHRGSLSDSLSSTDTAMQELKDEYTSALNKKEAAFTEDSEKLKADHDRIIAAKQQEHDAALEKLQTEHAAAQAKLQEELRHRIEELTLDVARSQEELAASAVKSTADSDAALAALKEHQIELLREVERGHEDEVTRIKAAHEDALSEGKAKAEREQISLAESHAQELASLRAERDAALAEAEASAQQERTTMLSSRAEEIATLKAEHQQATAELNAALVAAQEQYREALEQAELQREQLSAEGKSKLESVITEMEDRHAQERETLRKDRELVLDELESYKTAANETDLAREETRREHDSALSQKDSVISDLQGQLTGSEEEKASLAAEVEKLRAELSSTRSEQTKLVQEASKRRSLDDELERHRAALAEMHDSLQRANDERDAIQAEKSKQDALVQSLQAQLAGSLSPHESPSRLPGVSFTRANGLPPVKPPPQAPPPAVPPPPLPIHTAPINEPSISSTSSAFTTTSRGSAPDSPSTSITPSLAGGPSADPNLAVKVEEQAKQLEEQEVMIKTLNKQLAHCETDLQTHMDLVAKLETSLGTSEKNLRKARMHATDLARERDSLNAAIDNLRKELAEAKREVVNVRRSIVEEKQSLETKLDEERRQKERARAQLESRMEEVQRRKSKFACL